MATHNSTSHHIVRNPPPTPHFSTHRASSGVSLGGLFAGSSEPHVDILKLVISVLSLLMIGVFAFQYHLRDQPMDLPASDFAAPPSYSNKVRRVAVSVTSQLRWAQYLVNHLSSYVLGDNDIINAVAARLPSSMKQNTQPPGLGNADFSCFQNSIIQGFASLESLQPFLDKTLERSQGQNPPMTLFLNNITRRLNDRESAGKTLLIPKVLQTIHSWAQQDAQEYYSTIVESLDKEVREFFSTEMTDAGLKSLEHNEQSPGHLVGDKKWIERGNTLLNSHFPTAFENPLEGHFADRLGCVRCGYSEGLRLTPFNCITLSPRPDIRECLDQYMELERIEDVECPKCTLLKVRAQLSNLLASKRDFVAVPNSFENGSPNKENTLHDGLADDIQSRLAVVREALEKEDFNEGLLKSLPSALVVRSVKSKQTVIARASTAMVLHVNRSAFDPFTFRSFKNHIAMDFPETLNINRWCLDSQPKASLSHSPGSSASELLVNLLPPADEMEENDPRYDYQLRAVITHRGHHESGHFICYRKFSLNDFPVPVPAELRTPNEDGAPEDSTHQWFELSDERVSAVPESKVFGQVGSNTFMLFYEKIRDHDAPMQKLANKESDVIAKDSNLKAKEELADMEVSSGSEKTKHSTGTGSDDPFAMPSSTVESQSSSAANTAITAASSSDSPQMVRRTGFVNNEISMSSSTEKVREVSPV